jgi:hypothetical protein
MDRTARTPRAPRPLPARRVAHGLAAAAALVAAGPAGAAPPGSCEAVSRPTHTKVVELYTSEGCNSCPPADRWLSGLKARDDVLAAGFHVDYWDRLGWKDRFADPAFTARQAEGRQRAGARFSYTPQVLVDGRDWTRWPELPPDASPARVRIALERLDDARVRVRIEPLAGAPAELGLWWATLEDGHVSRVRAGENAGVMLYHDHVVRATAREAPWRADGVRELVLRLDAPRAGHVAQRLLVVVTDGARLLPLQAVQLAC